MRNEDEIIKEIILVDDGSREPIEQYVASFSAISSKILLFRQKNQGAGAARNMGARLATTNTIAFIDWDCMPREGWLRNLTKSIIEGDTVAVGGTILAYQTHNVVDEFSNFMKALREPVRDKKGKIILIITANAAFSKKIFEAVGGFDPRFIKAAGEDLDLTYKLSSAGYSDKLLYEPLAIVEHRHRSSFSSFLKQQFNYGFWDMYHFLLRKRDPAVLGVSLPTPVNVFKDIKDTISFSIKLIPKIPNEYGLVKKYFAFPFISIVRKMAVLLGGIQCYYFHQP